MCEVCTIQTRSASNQSIPPTYLWPTGGLERKRLYIFKKRYGMPYWLSRGTIDNTSRTYGTHENLPGLYLAIFYQEYLVLLTMLPRSSSSAPLIRKPLKICLRRQKTYFRRHIRRILVRQKNNEEIMVDGCRTGEGSVRH